MKEKLVIKFQSRYPKVWSKITHVEDKTWKYESNSQFMRCGFNDKTGDLIFVDPEGGPLIDVGSVIESKYVVNRIYRNPQNNKLMIEMV